MSQGLSIRRAFAWNSFGNALYNFAQWLIIIGLAHLSSPREVGRYSLALAITAPVFLTIGLNLRTAQITDAAGRWALRDYLALRTIVNLVAFAVVALIGLILNQGGAALAFLLVIAAAKSIEGTSQTYYGYFQSNNRLDLVSRSLILRAVLGPSLFLLAYALSGSLVVGAAALAVGWLLPQVLHDRPNAQRLYEAEHGTPIPSLRPIDVPAVASLAKTAAPLGVDAGVSSLAINLPRYAVQGVLGGSALGVYSALSFLAQTVSMLTSSMGSVIVPNLARAHHAGRKAAFVRSLWRLVAFGMVVAGVAIAGTLLVGRQVLDLIFPPEYVNVPLLLVLLLSAATITLQRMLAKSLEASRRFRIYATIDILTAATVGALAWPMTHQWGLLGAAWSLVAGFLIGTLAVLIALLDTVRKMP